MPNPRLLRRQGFTILELLIAIGIIALLIALILPAVLNSRGSARRMTCSANLKQLGIAIGAYEATHGVLPPGVNHMWFSTHVVLLPFLDQKSLYRKFDMSKFEFESPNKENFKHSVSVFRCPDNPARATDFHGVNDDFTNYIGSAGGGMPNRQNGLLINQIEQKAIVASQIVDGLSHTTLMSEAIAYPFRLRSPPLTGKGAIRNTTQFFKIPAQLPGLINACQNGPYSPTHYSLGNRWREGSMATTRFIHILPPNSPSCENDSKTYLGLFSPTSLHSGGVNTLFADGAVRFMSDSIDRELWVALGTRAGRESVSSF